MKEPMEITDATILITGGTRSFGNGVAALSTQGRQGGERHGYEQGDDRDNRARPEPVRGRQEFLLRALWKRHGQPRLRHDVP